MAEPVEDPVVLSGRREALITFAVFVVAVTYTVVYCTLNGYERNVEQMTFILGFPDWVFWGVLAPWAVCTGIGVWMSFYFITDAVLEEAEPTAEDVAEEVLAKEERNRA